MQDSQSVGNQAGGNDEWLSIGEAAALLSVSRDTLRRWGKKGKIKTYRTPTNRRCYKKSELTHLFSPGASQVPPSPTVKSSPSAQVVKIEEPQQTHTESPSQSYANTSILQPAVQPIQSDNQHITTRGITVETEKLAREIQGQTTTTPTPEKPQAQPQPVKEEYASDDMEIVQIKPQATSYQNSPPNTDQQTTASEPIKKEKKSVNILKIVILVISVFLILAGIVIVGLVFLYPSDSTATILSPV
jgi:excisionase family DNA binding protein